ncbi:MAG: hypothetical protein CMM60_09770 [Rhodospirillaceae bacterium]|nr:hypothetical protein [Rhodospirillaceae bacterium]
MSTIAENDLFLMTEAVFRDLKAHRPDRDIISVFAKLLDVNSLCRCLLGRQIACPGQNPLPAAFLEHALEQLQRAATDGDGDFTP